MIPDEIEWPREIWAAAKGEHEPRGEHVFSQHATVPRWEGDDAEFHRYVDGDMYDSQEAYYKNMLEGEREARIRLDAACRQKDEAMGVLFDRLNAAGVDYSDLLP